jgi:hypothetical protein
MYITDGCRIVTVKEIKPLFKGEDPANAIEVIHLEEVGNQVVAQKDLYSIGEKVVFVEPDWCIPDVPLFEEYYRPMGDAKKCKLGKGGRVRAIKFNLHTGDNQPFYSYGILISHRTLAERLGTTLINMDNMAKSLGITKYVEPEPRMSNAGSKSGVSCPFPDAMYKTDETNIYNVINDVVFPIRLIGTFKSDGSSITIWNKGNKQGIASRNQGRPLMYNKVIGTTKPFWSMILEVVSFGKYKAKRTKKIYQTVENDDQFIKYGKHYLEKLAAYGKDIALRGELCGMGAKGSGNPNNPQAKEATNIQFFGIDDYTHGARKMEWHEVKRIAEELGLPMVREYFGITFQSKEDLFKVCQDIFNSEKKEGRTIEGIVVRTEDGKFSAKVMNLEYDSKK